MRICYVASDYGIYDEKIVSAAVSYGHQVHVVILKPRKLETREKTRGAVYWEIPAFPRKFPGGYPLLLYPYHYLRVFSALKRIIEDVEPHVLFGGNVQTAGFMCALTGRRPLLLMPFGSDILVYPRKSRVLKWITKYTITHSDIIVCDAESVKEEVLSLASAGKGKILVIASGIDLSLFNPQVESDTKAKLGWSNNLVVTCTRNHKKVYGIEHLLDAVPQVIQNDRTVRFLIIGTGPLTAELKERVRQHGMEDYVRFAGYVPNTELPRYLRASDIYVSPSLSDGTSVSLLEAMACGLPVVVTDLPANREWIADGGNGRIVPAKDSKSLSESISSLCRDRETRSVFGQRNYEIAQERANIECNTAEFEKTYRELTGYRP